MFGSPKRSAINYGCGSCGQFGARKKRPAVRSALLDVDSAMIDGTSLGAFILGRLGLPNPHYVDNLLRRTRRSRKPAAAPKKKKTATPKKKSATRKKTATATRKKSATRTK